MKSRKSPIYDEEIALDVARELIKTGSFLINFNQRYEWKSGIVAPTYCNCRYLSTSYKSYSKIVTFMNAIIKNKFDNVDSIVGIATSGIPWSSQVAFLSEKQMAFVRSKVKEYGVGKLVDCKPKQNSKVILIDDLCGSGKSIYKAKKALYEEYNIEVIACLTIVNWGFTEMWELLGDNEMEIISLTSYEQLLAVAQKENLITNEQYKKLEKFYNNPFSYQWE